MQKRYKDINVNYEFYDNDSNENLIFFCLFLFTKNIYNIIIKIINEEAII